LPNEITDIFVEDYLDGNGSRNYQNLWFFSEKYIMESKSFISTDDFDITPIKSKIEYVRVRKQYYDIGHTTEKSRLNLEFGMDTKAGGDVKASKENCEYLWKIATKYVYHNLKK